MTHATPVAIAAGSPLTTSAGMAIAQQGGNAVDVAVAAALTATLSEVLMCSVGGSAFLMIQMPGQPPELIDGADAIPSGHLSLAPESAGWREVHLPYGDGITVRGGHASVAVPGMLAALETAWRRHGSLPWSEIVDPALELAQQKFPLGTTTARWLKLAGNLLFDQQPASRECFFPTGEQPLQAGELFQIPDIAETLDMISREGARAFYEGDLAAAFAEEMSDHGGFVTRSDLANYRAQVRQPLQLYSHGFELALNPPPAVGGAALGSLIRILEMSQTSNSTPAERTRQQVQAQAAILRLRQNEFIASDFDQRAAQVLLEEEILRQHLNALNSPHTMQISVASSSGELVSMTMSSGYGSGITIPKTGIICNNSLGEPELNPQGFLVAPPGSRLVSNMVPTLAWHPDGRCLAFGTPGASRITTSMAQMWTRYAAEGVSLDGAVAAPRLHVESTSEGLRVLCEPGIDTSLLSSDVEIYPFEQLDMFFGAIKVVSVDPQGHLQAIADPRREGAVEVSN